jgi:hypothetical protein
MPCSNARTSSTLLPCLAAGLLLVSLPAASGEIYQWKDGKGVTHYSDSPPPNQMHKSRAINPRGTAVAAAAAKPAAVNSDCSNASNNLKVLQGTGEVGLDADKDGKAERPLTPKERADRIQQAQRNITTYCEVALANDP